MNFGFKAVFQKTPQLRRGGAGSIFISCAWSYLDVLRAGKDHLDAHPQPTKDNGIRQML